MKHLITSALSLVLVLSATARLPVVAQQLQAAAPLPQTAAPTHSAQQLVTAPPPQAAPPRYYPPAREAYRDNPMIVCGNYTLYNFDVPAPTPVPKGFKPFYISTYNRHGARTYGSDTGYDVWHTILQAAKTDGQLTPRGEQLYDEFMAIYPLVANRAGDLTAIGYDQLREMGMRMYRNYPAVFLNHPVIDACSTNVPRVMLSMAAFCDGLKTCDPTLSIGQRMSQRDRPVLVPTSSSNPKTIPSDKEIGKRDEAYIALMDDHIDYTAFLSRFFRDISYAYKGGRTNTMDICRWLYNVAVDLPCVTTDHNLMQFLTEDELFYFWRAENYRFYSVGSRTPLYKGRNWALHEILLRDIINRAEEDMATGDVQVRLRFGHDFFLIGLATLLDLDGWNIEESDPEKVDEVFRHYEVPMGMNMQFIFYRNKLGDILVKALLNDRECRFRIAGFDGPYYPWTAFKAFCEARLAVADKILESTKK